MSELDVRSVDEHDVQGAPRETRGANEPTVPRRALVDDVEPAGGRRLHRRIDVGHERDGDLARKPFSAGCTIWRPSGVVSPRKNGTFSIHAWLTRSHTSSWRSPLISETIARRAPPRACTWSRKVLLAQLLRDRRVDLVERDVPVEVVHPVPKGDRVWLLTMTSTIFTVTHAHKKALIIVISSISIISVWLYFGTNASSCHGPSAGSLA